MKMPNLLLLFLFAGLAGCQTSQKSFTAIQCKTIRPAFIRADDNPLLSIKINNPSEEEITIKEITLSTEGTNNPDDIESVNLYFTGNAEQFSPTVLFGKTQQNPHALTFKGMQTLKPGNNYFWVSGRIKENASLQNKINFVCQSIQAEEGKIILQDSGTLIPSSIGIVVRKRNDDGSKDYRIPGLICTPKGTLVSTYDIRWNNSADLQEDIDVGVSRSNDGGQTWLPMQKGIDMEEWGGKSNRENGVGDAAILVDPQTGRIWIGALWLHGHANKRAWWASQPGLTPQQTGQFVITYSDDEGASWSTPVSITPQIKKPEWYLCFNGPGMGITTQDGTLVFPAQYKDKNQMPFSTIVYSKDKGKTWHIGSGAKSNTTEAQVVELTDGSLMLNMRDNRGGSRSVAITRDWGKTWEEHPSSREALPEPVCQASLIRITLANGQKALAFFNPATTQGRNHYTLKLSMDDGMTWPEEYHKLVYEPEGFGYSCLAQLNATTLGVLYEGNGELYFQQIDLNEIIPQ